MCSSQSMFSYCINLVTYFHIAFFNLFDIWPVFDRHVRRHVRGTRHVYILSFAENVLWPFFLIKFDLSLTGCLCNMCTFWICSWRLWCSCLRLHCSLCSTTGERGYRHQVNIEIFGLSILTCSLSCSFFSYSLLQVCSSCGTLDFLLQMCVDNLSMYSSIPLCRMH